MIRRILLVINKLSDLLNSINEMLVQKFAIFIIISNA